MIKNLQPVKNPLTIIGMFASIIEVSGNYILPKLSGECQLYYIWFLIIFPLLLTICFFIFLWFKPERLYAPSDFKDENNFFKCISRATRQDIINQKMQDFELEKAVEIGSQLSGNQSEAEPSNFSSTSPINRNFNPRNRLQKYYVIEKAVFDYVANKYHTRITKGIGVQGQLEKIFFDGFFYINERRYFLEIKYTTRLVLIQQHIDRIIGQFMRVNAIAPDDTLLLIFVYKGEISNIQNRITIPEYLPFNLEIEYLKEENLKLDVESK